MSIYRQLHRLNFSFVPSAKSIYYCRWKEWKKKIEDSSQKDVITYYDLMEEWKNNCKIKSNKKLKPIDVYYNEGYYGGLHEYYGEDHYKKIIIKKNYNKYYNIYHVDKDDITMDILYTGEKNFWSVEEMDDLISGFIKTTKENNSFIDNNIVDGYVQITEISSFRL